MNEHSIEVKATPFLDGRIVVETESVSDGRRKTIERRVLESQEAVVQQSLVALGWTPPDSESPVIADVPMLVDAIVGKGFASDRQRDAALKAGYVALVDGRYQWVRSTLSMLSVRKLLGIYTDGSLNV